MRKQITENGVVLWLSERDTEQWATKPGAVWPCSAFRGHRLCATFDSNGLVDLSIDGKYPEGEWDSNEFNAITSDHLRDVLPKDHPCYFIAVGQFDRK